MLNTIKLCVGWLTMLCGAALFAWPTASAAASPLAGCLMADQCWGLASVITLPCEGCSTIEADATVENDPECVECPYTYNINIVCEEFSTQVSASGNLGCGRTKEKDWNCTEETYMVEIDLKCSTCLAQTPWPEE